MPDLTGTPLELMDYIGNPALTILVHLGKNNNPTDELTELALADIEELVAPGYAPIRATDFVIDPESADDAALARSAPILFVFDGLVTPVVATFAYTTFRVGAGDIVLGQIFPFEPPERITVSGQNLEFQFTMSAIDMD